MAAKSTTKLSRRDFMKLSAAATTGLAFMPGIALSQENIISPMKRSLGKLNFEATTLGLGGQAALQWTPEDVNPVQIILKAFNLGINYYDTSNLYGPSQLNYGKAFKELRLIPGKPEYNKNLRESIFLTSKTAIRWAKGDFPPQSKVRNNSNGQHGGGAIADLKRTLSQIFGDDQGNYPEGAYLDMILTHNITSIDQVDVLYEGFETPLIQDENFGALIALRDYRDGTNLTGLNPKNEKLVRHIGLSGHSSATVMMDMIRRDQWNLLDGMLVAINVNDRRYQNMQYNVIELAKGKDMGVIGMKVFSDGAMYTKEAKWGNTPEELVRTVGSDAIPSKSLIEYTLTTPGVDTVIIGISQIDENLLKCQLVQNFYASQIKPDALSTGERRELEKLGLKAKNGMSNYFQKPDTGLTPPLNIRISKNENIKISWDSAIAGDEPISHYEIIKNEIKIKEVKHAPQISNDKPFTFETDNTGNQLVIITVDKAGRKAESAGFKI
jgi:predicted aldo/keto reductase-like oxidoreductase